jgi:hypothetical protein
MATQKANNWKIFVIAGGFYFFGNEVESTTPGFIACTHCSMFGGFGGGKGMPGVARGDKEATVTLDRFPEGDTQYFPLTAVYGIINSVNLYEFSGTTLR